MTCLHRFFVASVNWVQDSFGDSIRTLMLHDKLRLVAIDSKPKEDGTDFRILFGLQEVGAAWKAKAHETEPRDYLSAVIDDLAFIEPIRTAMFEDNGKLAMVWRRKG